METITRPAKAGTDPGPYYGSSSYFRRLAANMKENYELYLFILPAIAVIFIFNYIPMYGIQIAFKSFVPSKGIAGSAWVGMDQFIRFFNSYQFWDLIKNTVTISLYSIAVGFPFPIILALMLNQVKHRRFRSFVQTVSYAPHFISVVVVVGMLLIFLSPTTGLVGILIKALGGTPIDFMGEPSWYQSLYVFSDVWQHTGWDSIIYFAALSTIDTQLYDAASVDGINKWQRVLYIDIPFLIPTVVILFILRTGSIMGVGFEKAFLMQNPLNMGVNEIIATYVYKIGIISSQYSYSAAIGLFNTVINFVFLMAVNKISKQAGNISLW
jgi:putative aldouronate transport system permease protein